MIQVVFSFFFCDSHYKECWLSTISAFTTVILSFLSNVLWIYFPFLFLLFCSQENRFMLSSASPSQLSVPTSGTTAVALSASKCKYRYRFWMDLFGCMRCLVHYSFPFFSKFIFPSFLENKAYYFYSWLKVSTSRHAPTTGREEGLWFSGLSFSRSWKKTFRYYLCCKHQIL